MGSTTVNDPKTSLDKVMLQSKHESFRKDVWGLKEEVSFSM
jgi:hypothetical protein